MPEGEMLERAGKSAPYTFGHDAQKYDAARIYETADLATRPQAGDLARLLEQRVDRDSVVRFWVASGLLIRAMRDVDREQVVQAARGMTTDTSPYVRCIANETMARFGSQADRAAAMKLLVRLANTRDTNTFVGMMAMNSLDWCNPTRAEIGNSLQGLPAKDPALADRYRSYIPNLVQRIESIAK